MGFPLARYGGREGSHLYNWNSYIGKTYLYLEGHQYRFHNDTLPSAYHLITLYGTGMFAPCGVMNLYVIVKRRL